MGSRPGFMEAKSEHQEIIENKVACRVVDVSEDGTTTGYLVCKK